MDGVELTKVISQTHPNTAYIDSDTELVDYLKTHTKKGDVIAFLGSHGFRGMIEESVKMINDEMLNRTTQNIILET